MKIKRISTSETVSIEDGFFWSDEFSWKAKEQSLEYAMDGTPIIQEGSKLSGRPITLQPADSGRQGANKGLMVLDQEARRVVGTGGSDRAGCNHEG